MTIDSGRSFLQGREENVSKRNAINSHCVSTQFVLACCVAGLLGCAQWDGPRTAYYPSRQAGVTGSLPSQSAASGTTGAADNATKSAAAPAVVRGQNGYGSNPWNNNTWNNQATAQGPAYQGATNQAASNQGPAGPTTILPPPNVGNGYGYGYTDPGMNRAAGSPPIGTQVFDPGLPPPGGPQVILEDPNQPYIDLDPTMSTPVDVYVEETQTGRFMFGAGINSDAGVTGQIVIDERNFDLFRVPTSFQDVINGTAFRGAGQGFRLEAMPGSQVQRYLISFTEPYLFDTQISFNISGFIYDRRFFDWDEERLGGRMAFGYRLTHDMSLSASIRGERVDITNPRVLGVPELDRALGKNSLYSGKLTLTHDTRDIPFAPTQGHLVELSAEQAFGDFDYPRADIDLRQYFLIRERPDSSGRHTLGFSLRLGFTGSQTPIYENYFAGGFSTIRGFDFRGASPVDGGVRVGGEFSMLGSTEYLFPLTADDMVKGALFVDYGTVEEKIEIRSENYRVAPGFGLRVNIPALGPAPLALDFAFPVAHADTDDKRTFSFFLGVGR